MYSFTFVIKYFISVKAEFPVGIDYIISPCQHLKAAYKEQVVVSGFHFTPLMTWLHVVANKSIFPDLTLSGQFS